MKSLLGLIALGALLFAGYYFYSKNSQDQLSPQNSPGQMSITQSPGRYDDIFRVLGTTTGKIWESGITGLNTVTDGAAEPVINKAVEDLQSRIKELPREQYEKVKYEFCKDVVSSFEESQ